MSLLNTIRRVVATAFNSLPNTKNWQERSKMRVWVLLLLLWICQLMNRLRDRSILKKFRLSSCLLTVIRYSMKAREVFNKC